jgi:hypothetical protein
MINTAILSLGTVLCSLFLAAVAGRATGAHADGPVLALDVDPTGNGPAEIGSVDTCVSVTKGDSFQIDILIENVKDLLAWEIYFQYDPAILQVTQRDVRLFQQANPGSSVYDLSEKVPDDDGLYRLSAADTSFPPTPDSGSGVLAKLTLNAVGSGTSELSLASEDLDGDGQPDRGPFLRDADTNIIGDSSGDTFFDGETLGAQAAVDQPCPPGSNGGGASATGDGASGVRVLYFVGSVLAAATVAALGALTLLSRRRARARPVSD